MQNTTAITLCNESNVELINFVKNYNIILIFMFLVQLTEFLEIQTY